MVVATDPRINESRVAKERTIWVVDIVVYALVFSAGLSALLFTPNTVILALGKAHWIISLWGAVLLFGGSVGLIGRATKRWIVEIPGTAASIGGGLLYFAILFSATFDNNSAITATILVGIMIGSMVRRYIELQIFTSEPGDRSLLALIRAAIRRRTTHTVGDHR
jgi:uncharacterized membrane protein